MKLSTWIIWIFNLMVLVSVVWMCVAKIPIQDGFVQIVGIIECAIGGTKVAEKVANIFVRKE